MSSPFDHRRLPHAGIQALRPYVPGKPIEALKQELGLSDIIKMASNENPAGCSPDVVRTLAALRPDKIAQYPAPKLHPIQETLARKVGLPSNQVFLSNGSDFIFYLLLILFSLHQKDKHMLTHDKAFMTYAIQAQTLGVPYVVTPLLSHWAVDVPALIQACNTNTALIFIANPNNPTGLLLPKEQIQNILDSVPKHCIVVIDEAYYEFAYADKAASCLPFLDHFPNLVITRTFSKAYGLAGLRLGYAMASPSIIALLERIQLPFTVNVAAMEAALSALEDTDFLTKTIANNQSGLAQMCHGLEGLGLDALPSHGNFITFDCGQKAAPVYQRLLEHGIIVRPLDPYQLDNCLRVTISTEENNRRFLEALGSILSKKIKE